MCVCVWFRNHSVLSHQRVFYHDHVCLCVGDDFCSDIKDELDKNQGKKVEKEREIVRAGGGGGGKGPRVCCSEGGAAMFCSPGVFFSLPPPVSPPLPPLSQQ